MEFKKGQRVMRALRDGELTRVEREVVSGPHPIPGSGLGYLVKSPATEEHWLVGEEALSRLSPRKGDTGRTSPTYAANYRRQIHFIDDEVALLKTPHGFVAFSRAFFNQHWTPDAD